MLHRVASEIGKSVAWVRNNVSGEEVASWGAFFRLQAKQLQPEKDDSPLAAFKDLNG